MLRMYAMHVFNPGLNEEELLYIMSWLSLYYFITHISASHYFEGLIVLYLIILLYFKIMCTFVY